MINQADNMLFRLSNLDKEQQRVTYQMSTGKKLQYGSDDANLYARDLYVDDKIRTYEGLQDQITKTTAQNNISDSRVAEIKSTLEYIQSELIKANNATTTDEGRTAIAINIEGMRQNILDLANANVEGEYVFAGSDSSLVPFVEENGSIVYKGDNGARKVAVDEGSYRQKSVNGYELMFYPSDTAYKGETLNFYENDKIFDQDGYEWKLNSPTNDTLTKYDFEGNATTETLAVTNDAGTPPQYSTVLPSDDGTKFQAKTNIFDLLQDIVNALNKVDNVGNPITNDEAMAKLSTGLTEVGKAFDGVNETHAKLGGRNRVFEVSLERVNAKLNQYVILSQEIGAADLAKVAVEAKALELTYTALYSTINKTNQLSLVNFIN